ncbi:MAG TPA: GWxTD domain-containing protein [Gemmatimonadaceae bacterium]|nr:GWxTD domain-containing protein [Gemmatimonadaceae bacterium]
MPLAGSSRAAAFALLIGSVLAPDARAQEAARPGDAIADSLIAAALDRARAGDTSSALRTLDRATKVAPKHAIAHYQRGVMLSRSSDLGMSDLFRRRSATNAIKRALDLDPGNPLYLIELGRLRLKTPFLRLDAQRLFRRALEAAEKRGDRRVLADVRWELGQIHERRFITMANRRLMTSTARTFDPEYALEDWHYTHNFFTQWSVPIDDAGELDYRKAEEHYRAALEADSAHLGAATGLLGLLHDGFRYEEMSAVAMALRQASPNEPRLLMAQALALHRLGRDHEAGQLFDLAIPLLRDEERHDMLNLVALLRKADASEYAALGDSARAEFEALYWSLADPLRLTPVNEAKLEFLSRVTYADLRFSSAEFGIRGWHTDRGDILMRYGPPPMVGTVAPETGESLNNEAIANVTTVWYYPDTKLRFVFVGPPAMNSSRFAGDFRAYAENARYIAPVSFANIEERFPIDSIGVQVARFRADRPDAVDVSVFADVPTAAMLRDTDVREASLETGFFLSDLRRRTLVADRDTAIVRLTDDRPDAVSSRSWRRTLAPGDYLYRVEARQPISGRNARGLAALPVAPFTAGTHQLSDILVARHIGLKSGGDKPTSRDDLLIMPAGRLTFAPGDTIFLYWESYGLVPDSNGVGRARIDLALRVDQLHRQTGIEVFLGGIGDALGITAKGDDRVSLTYDRSINAGAMDRAPDHLALGLGSAPPGTYTLEITVTDLVANVSATRQRVLQVRAP